MNNTEQDISMYMMREFPEFYEWLKSRFLNYNELSEYTLNRLELLSNVVMPDIISNSEYELDLVKFFLSESTKYRALERVIDIYEDPRNTVNELQECFDLLPPSSVILDDVLERLVEPLCDFKQVMEHIGYNKTEILTTIIIAYVNNYDIEYLNTKKASDIPYYGQYFNANSLLRNILTIDSNHHTIYDLDTEVVNMLYSDYLDGNIPDIDDLVYKRDKCTDSIRRGEYCNWLSEDLEILNSIFNDSDLLSFTLKYIKQEENLISWDLSSLSDVDRYFLVHATRIGRVGYIIAELIQALQNKRDKYVKGIILSMDYDRIQKVSDNLALSSIKATCPTLIENLKSLGYESDKVDLISRLIFLRQPYYEGLNSISIESIPDPKHVYNYSDLLDDLIILGEEKI